LPPVTTSGERDPAPTNYVTPANGGPGTNRTRAHLASRYCLKRTTSGAG
jgi:hypothetical protein